MPRALLIVADSLGIGGAPDAACFGDAGADTFGHVLQACAPPLPHLRALGLHAAHALAQGRLPRTHQRPGPGACWAAMQPASAGKDTTSGHWELCGAPVDCEWGRFTAPEDRIPATLLDALCARAGVYGIATRHRVQSLAVRAVSDQLRGGGHWSPVQRQCGVDAMVRQVLDALAG